MPYVIRLIGLRSKHGRVTEHDGRLLKRYEPSWLLTHDLYVLQTTDRQEEALTFATLDQAVRCWNQPVHGLRPDGQPARPLTVFDVAVESTRTGVEQ
jgi:hypothetical protein